MQELSKRQSVSEEHKERDTGEDNEKGGMIVFGHQLDQG